MLQTSRDLSEVLTTDELETCLNVVLNTKYQLIMSANSLYISRIELADDRLTAKPNFTTEKYR